MGSPRVVLFVMTRVIWDQIPRIGYVVGTVDGLLMLYCDLYGFVPPLVGLGGSVAVENFLLLILF